LKQQLVPQRRREAAAIASIITPARASFGAAFFLGLLLETFLGMSSGYY